MHYVYILLEKESGKNYIGFTSNLRDRVAKHKSGSAAQTTRNGRWELIYYEAYLDKADAMARERRLKYDGRARQQLLKRISGSMSTCLK